MKSNLETMLVRVRDGQIDFGRFVEATRPEFRAMAGYLMRKWPTPQWLHAGDVEQDLYLGAWSYIWRFEAGRGPTFARYVVFNAMSAAKREIHKARGVTINGSPDKKASRIEAPLSTFGDDGEGEAMLASILAEGPRAEDEVIEAQERRQAATRALRACVSSHERYAVLAIRESGSLDKAGRLLYDDVDHRTTLRLGNEEQAERFISKHAGAVARRIGVRRFSSERSDAGTSPEGER